MGGEIQKIFDMVRTGHLDCYAGSCNSLNQSLGQAKAWIEKHGRYRRCETDHQERGMHEKAFSIIIDSY